MEAIQNKEKEENQVPFFENRPPERPAQYWEKPKNEQNDTPTS